ncbi:hypothetical protein [Streptomyces kebangsaanensis]|uniref:hypothetical protein n=1 Tax=Streptomyces kebangsaanensis TaxID=864058 RepID=UPI00093B3A24|nr:hypothetical protein [Streptomyces kebangsaanensis]
MDLVITLAVFSPAIALGLALVTDHRGLRTFFQGGSTEQKYRIPVLLTGWLFVVLPLYAIVGATIMMFW